jgi:hypothetical protein
VFGRRYFPARYFPARYFSGGGGEFVETISNRTLIRLEVWSTWACDSGTRLAFLPVSECQTLVTIERTQHDDEGQIVMSKQSASAASLDVGTVIRFLFSDGGFTEWIVWTIDDASRESQLLRISLRSVLTTLDSGAAMLSETTGTVTTVDLEWKAFAPSDIVDKILTFSPSWWTVGTVDPTIPVDLSPSGWMPLRALRELVSAIKAQAVGCELHYRRNGTSGYYIDIVTSIGSSVDALDVRTAKNLLGTSRRRDREKYAVAVVPLGTGSPRATIGKAWWECTAKSTNVLTMQQPVTGGAMLGFDDQLNTSLYLVDDTGTEQQITDCVAGATQQITVASGTNFTVGRWYRVVANTSGDEIVELPKAAGTTGPIRAVESSSLDGASNMVPNPAMRVWTGGASVAPDGWTKSANGTITLTTTPGLWVYGGQSALFENGAGAANLVSPLTAGGYFASATTLTWSAWVRILQTGDGGGDVLLVARSGTTGSTTATMANIKTGYALNTWHRVDYSASISSGFHALGVGLTYSLGDPSTRWKVYIDSVQVDWGTSARPFVEGSNPSKLWALGNQYLGTYSTAPTSYGCSFADLGQWDPVRFANDVVALGQTANVRDTDLGVTTTGRIIELKRDWKNPLASQLTISTRPEEFVSQLTGIAA